MINAVIIVMLAIVLLLQLLFFMRKDSLVHILRESQADQRDALLAFSKSVGDSLMQIQSGVYDKLSRSVDSQNIKLSGLKEDLRGKLDERLEKIQLELRTALFALQSGNEKKLDEMRGIVDEKLERTLSARLQKSFETVGVQLESVNKGLGEMRSVAESVGSLNKVLANTKTRGILGEIQLSHIIEDMLPPHLYDREVPTFAGSRDRVEYAVKFPGVRDGQHVYLPIDSKFPLEDYYKLEDSFESGDSMAAENARKALFARLKTFAGDVRHKYLSPPETTNFAILFLPTEGLFAETARNPAFCDERRREGIIIAGPSTLSALLNSFQMGFSTLQIQKRAADIEKMLGVVKREFENFGNILLKTQEKIRQADAELDKLVGVRTRAINRRLRGVQSFDGDEARNWIETQAEID
jgi:DNA recombination protein RmuC